MRWIYTRVSQTRHEIDSYLDALKGQQPPPTTDDEVASFLTKVQACDELKAKLDIYRNYGPDPRGELKPGNKIGLLEPEAYYLSHKGLYVTFYRDLSTTSAIAMGFLPIDSRVNAFIKRVRRVLRQVRT